MSTTLLDPICSLRPATHSSGTRTALPPAVYIGTVERFHDVPAIELYNLLAPLGEHPTGSTVSRKTLERFGYRLPAIPRAARQASA